MVQAVIDIPEEANHILNIVKARYNLKTKSEAIARVVLERGGEILEPEIRPEYLEKLKRMSTEKGIPFKNIDELRKIIEG
ncbi:MAG: antitoxin [Nanoarchaeota archaeon]